MSFAKLISTWFRNGALFCLVSGLVGLILIFVLDRESVRGTGSLRTLSSIQFEKQHSELFKVVDNLNDSFEKEWSRKRITPANQADSLLVARRLSLGLTGTIPSLEEIRELQSLPSEQRSLYWVNRLLEDSRTSDFLAERFARTLVGVESGPFLIYRRRRFVSWLAEEIHANRPYDSVVRKLVTATGLWTDRPQVNFLTRTVNQDMEPQRPDPVQLAGRTSRAFLGMRIDCLQCHDDFLGNVNVGTLDEPRSGTQADFHALAAFFHQPENSLSGIKDNPAALPYRTRLLGEAEEETIDPAVPIWPKLIDNKIANPRERLAKWITHRENRSFARATVNRVWAIMFGQPLISPVDDIPLAGPFPNALEILVDDFIQHGYDVHRLIRVIALSHPFSIDCTTNSTVTSEHQESWAVFPLTRLRPEQMAGAMLQATRVKAIDSTSHILTQLTSFGQQNEFVQRFGDPGENEFQDRGETVTQRLLLFNGDMVAENLSNGLNIPVRLNQLTENESVTIETIFLSTLTRLPTDEEKKRFRMQLAESESAGKSTADLYWALINCAEFRWNH